MPSARSWAYRTVAGFVIAPMMPALILAGIVLGVVFLGLFAGLAGFDGDAADPAWLNLLANLAFLLPFVLVCALGSAMAFWWIARPDLQRP